jgi:hypothetical protein
VAVVSHLEQDALAFVQAKQTIETLVRVDDHGAELNHLERPALQADTFGQLEHRTLAGQFDSNGGGNHHRRSAGWHHHRASAKS